MSSPAPLLGGEQEGQRTATFEWRVQQLGWVVMALIVFLALLGVFSTGPLSWSSAAAADGTVEVQYQRFVRNGGNNSLSVRVPASAVENGEARVWVSNEYLANVEVTQIVPEPRSQLAEAGGVLLTFEVAEGATELAATISATGDAIGVQRARVAVNQGDPVDFWQLYYP